MVLTAMNHNGTGRRSRRFGAILALALLALTTGLCVLAAGHAMADDEAMAPDLCVLMLAVTFTLVLLPGPLLCGRRGVAPVSIAPQPRREALAHDRDLS